MTGPRSRTEVLKEALRTRHEEPFEKALGRAIRHLGGPYSEYLALIAVVRDYARTHDLDLRAAARTLANQS